MTRDFLIGAASGLLFGAILGLFLFSALFVAALDDRIREATYEAFDLLLRLRRMINRDINQPGQPFDGTAYDFGIYLIEKIDAVLPEELREREEERERGKEQTDGAGKGDRRDNPSRGEQRDP